ncbi:RAB6-interacting golgin [Strongylocentrotus purpuratus]|uniref:RAB6-interacting golgin n=1 Tax=Strongylocentrotus purpuratus TaxID=7668 RepID=A0A7M7GE97_STRPU|nr:RAB6-interacting golgin [Strongylocentrotus purpuratus]
MDPKRVVKDIEKESQEAVKEEEVEKFKILDEEEGHERETFKLGEFQKKQKQMEEDNVRKKKLLFRAIADRKKKTQAEAKRLLYIQKELAKIETLLTNDVSILRDRIEEVSRDFNDAQQRYQRAETEFVDAKIHLHKSSEMKELLTEHLCTIIHENELRKAKKLEELVSKLDVESLEEFEIPEETPPTSPVPITVPHQSEVTKNPSENNGMAQVSSNNPGNLPNEKEDSIVPPGASSDKLNSTAALAVSSPSNNAEQSERFPNDKADESDEKTDGKITDSTVSCDQGGKKDEKLVTENESDLSSNNPESSRSPSSSDQPEAEQHVELNANQT